MDRIENQVGDSTVREASPLCDPMDQTDDQTQNHVDCEATPTSQGCQLVGGSTVDDDSTLYDPMDQTDDQTHNQGGTLDAMVADDFVAGSTSSTPRSMLHDRIDQTNNHMVREAPIPSLALIDSGSHLITTGLESLLQSQRDNMNHLASPLSSSHSLGNIVSNIAHNEVNVPIGQNTAPNDNATETAPKVETVPIRRTSLINLLHIDNLLDEVEEVVIDHDSGETMTFCKNDAFPLPKRETVDSRMIKRDSDLITGSRPFFETVSKYDYFFYQKLLSFGFSL